jgi:Na+/H+ antiporter
MESKTPKLPSPLLSIIPIVVLIILLSFIVRILADDALSGASQVALLIATAVAAGIAMINGTKWKAIEESIASNIAGVSVAVIVLLLIGCLSAAWMISGIVPAFIYYGVELIQPKFFLLSTCFICSVISVVTGSSWTTVATIGIALLGIGQAQGFSDGWIAGAIISGAYYGDKISPLSDTVILTVSVTETPLYTHIRYLMTTTTPAMLIALLVYTIAGFMFEPAETNQILGLQEAIRNTFDLSPWLMVVPIITIALIIKKVSPVITLFASSIIAIIFAVIFQPELLQRITESDTASLESLFKGSMITLYGSTAIETGNDALNGLVSTRGMAGMMNTVWLILCAMCFGGAMVAGGMIKSLTNMFLRFIKGALSLVSSTVSSGLLLNLCVGDQYMAILLLGNMYKDVYKEKGYESKLLGRSTEDAVTVTSPLVPWNSCGMTQSTVLGVATLTYLPFCLFNLLCPVMSIVMTAIGYKIKRTRPQE